MSKSTETIQKLININEDACDFYSTALEKAESPQLKDSFRNLETLHKGVVINLEQYNSLRGENREPQKTLAGQARQTWGKLEAKISNDTDKALVKNLEETEDRCLHSIQDAIQDNDISSQAKALLMTEMQALQKSHDYMRALKECMQ